jgi:hypothetical protein
MDQRRQRLVAHGRIALHGIEQAKVRVVNSYLFHFIYLYEINR